VAGRFVRRRFCVVFIVPCPSFVVCRVCRSAVVSFLCKHPRTTPRAVARSGGSGCWAFRGFVSFSRRSFFVVRWFVVSIISTCHPPCEQMLAAAVAGAMAAGPSLVGGEGRG
jgi:hypothetical protein